MASSGFRGCRFRGTTVESPLVVVVLFFGPISRCSRYGYGYGTVDLPASTVEFQLVFTLILS